MHWICATFLLALFCYLVVTSFNSVVCRKHVDTRLIAFASCRVWKSLNKENGMHERLLYCRLHNCSCRRYCCKIGKRFQWVICHFFGTIYSSLYCVSAFPTCWWNHIPLLHHDQYMLPRMSFPVVRKYNVRTTESTPVQTLSQVCRLSCVANCLTKL